ncbi:MAG: SDR family oxidoreductase [Balneola sp.]
MTILIVGATGATGSLLVKQLLDEGHSVKVMVRSKEKLSELEKAYPNLIQIRGTVLEMSSTELADILKECDAVCSCLGHNLTFKGMFGKPRKLVTDSIKKICNAVDYNKPSKPVKVVLMNTNGNTNRDLNEKYSFKDRLVISIIRVLIPPHSDNEQAADYLRSEIGQDHSSVEWVAVRPDNLIDEEKVTEYSVNPSPVRGVIFDSGKTSRINVANFMARLAYSDFLWKKWKGQMPVINN